MLPKQLADQVKEMLDNNASQLPSSMAEELNVSEGAVVLAFPNEIMTRVSGEHAQSLLTEIVQLGPVTTIIHSHGSIFEVKATFPKGKLAHGYYNLMGKEGQLDGHLRLDLITDIALVSKPFRGAESHYFGFFTQQGDSMFKIYLGRDKKRQLFPEQIEQFKQFKTQFGDI
jgi:putative heme utilization carrier protein HutX